MKRKIVTIIGARPQFIKAATVSNVFKSMERVEEVIVHTGQHFDHNMSSVFFDQMGIPKPDYYLNIKSKLHGDMTGRMLVEVEKILLKEKPDWVLVYGDTNSTLAGALAASKLNIPLAHIEAGLRSFNTEMPEEINRILTDRISQKLFCPTKNAKKNLEKEGFGQFFCDLKVSGDVMYDAALHFSKFDPIESSVKKILEEKKSFVLVTCHRAENTNDIEKLGNIITALNKISEKHRVVFPLHPRTKNMLEKFNLSLSFEVIDPVSYIDMLNLLKHCSLVLTDSGGLQKEAYFFEKFCLTMRDETEWVELVELGVNSLIGSNTENILKEFENKKDFSKKEKFPKNKIYGNGESSFCIAKDIFPTL